jgi:hypothetical protein
MFLQVLLTLFMMLQLKVLVLEQQIQHQELNLMFLVEKLGQVESIPMKKEDS